MALLVRKVRHDRWVCEDAEPLLQIGDVPADPLPDLQTERNLLSVWELESDRSNLTRIVRALSLGPDKVDHTGFVVFDSEHLDPAQIEIQENPGTSPDGAINHLHRDLVLSGKKLVALAHVLLRHGELGQLTRPILREMVEEGIRNGELREECRKKLRT